MKLEKALETFQECSFRYQNFAAPKWILMDKDDEEPQQGQVYAYR